MSQTIDCLFIGHNEMSFTQYEKTVRAMGTESGAYRDLNLNFIQHQNRLLTAGDAFNHFLHNHPGLDNSSGPFSLGNLFSLTIAYLGTYLYRRDFSFDYVNSFQDQKDELADKLAANNILAIAIPTTLYVSPFPIIEIVTFIRKYNDTARIIVGGPFIATQFRAIQNVTSIDYLLKMIDADIYINSSQGEATLSRTLYALKHELSLADIPNISYRKGTQYLSNPIVIENNDLSENIVDWRLFAGRLGKFAAVRTSTSCPFSCSFCGFPQHAGKYQTIDVQFIERELNLLQRIGTVESINIIDDTFNVPPERFKEIMRMMIKNKYHFRWNCNFRCQFADQETVALMKESGCEGALLGIESGSRTILKNMNKAATAEKYRRGLALLNEYGITSYGSFIIGFPGETMETVQETIRFLDENQPTFYRAQLWYCEPITPIFQERDKYQISGSQFEWSHATMDAKTASRIVEEIFKSTRYSVRVPQYNFEFYSIFNLLHRGLSIAQLKQFLQAFNHGVQEKLENPAEREISINTVRQLQNILPEGDKFLNPFSGETSNEDQINRYHAGFSF